MYTVQALPETEYDPLGRPTAKPPMPGDRTSPIYDQKTLMGALKNKCLHYQTNPPSWWTTEWCHRREIRQFHLQLVPLTPSDPATPLPHSTKMRQERNPDYSLGKFERSVIVREGGPQSVGNKSVPIIKVL